MIIGGGVVGCSIAYYVRKAGMEVTVLERGEIGAQASTAAAGLLAPLGPLAGPGPFADLLLASFARFPTLATELEEVSGIKPGYEQTGALRVVRNPKRVARLQKRLQAWEPLGLRMYWLSGDEARRIEPLLSADICAAIYAPEEAQINAARLVQAFALAAQNFGARISTHTPVERILHHMGRISAVQTAKGEIISCSHLVIAAGAWTAQVVAGLSVEVPVRPLNGQMLALKDVGLRHIIFGDAAYLVPRGDEVLVGATKEDIGFVTQVTAEGQAWLRDVAYRLAPALKASTVERQWAGLRPGTPDTRPVLGPVAGWSNLWLASGHNSVGIMLSPLTGQMIADCIMSGQVPELLRPFTLDSTAR
ncbi:MAG: glycine oxidase ThiO [Ktedonobacteraceae bacterium]